VTRVFVALFFIGLALAAGATHFTSAAFTNAKSVGASGVAVDQLSNHFSVASAGAVQAGTSTPVASGNVDGLSLDFGLVPSARTFTNVFRVTNVGSSSATAVMTPSLPAQVASVQFASSGSTTATLSAGASTTVSVTTSSTVAGRGSGTIRLGLGGQSWMYRTYSLTLDEAPEAPTGLTAVAGVGGKISLSWTAGTTTTNLAGYYVYRSSGGAYTNQNPTAPLTATSYVDTATVDGTTYTYKIHAVSSGTPTLESVDSTTATAKADATPPGQPTSVSLANGGGAGNAYINAANRGSINVSVGLAANSLTSDLVTVTLSTGGNSVSATTSGSNGTGTVTVSGINAGSLGDGTVTITAKSTDLAGNVSLVRSVTVTKDTAAPAAPSATYVDRNGTTADQITGSAEGNASITATETAPSSATFTTAAAANGSYTCNVAGVAGKANNKITVTYIVTATDAAGNTSAGTTVTFADAK
jgi:large repetitive protein